MMIECAALRSEFVERIGGVRLRITNEGSHGHREVTMTRSAYTASEPMQALRRIALRYPEDARQAASSSDDRRLTRRQALGRAGQGLVGLAALSEGGWFHNFPPRKLRDDELMTRGTARQHPRQINGQAEPW